MPRSPRLLLSYARAGCLALLLAAAAACAGGADATPQKGGGPGGGPGGPGGRDRNAATPVEVAEVRIGSLSRTVTVTGMLEAIRAISVNAQHPGALLDVKVREGDVVRAGQVLAEVDAREVSAQVRSAQAALALARATAERSDRLFRTGVITAPEHERDQAALAAAEATLEQLRTRLGFATVKAPMGGVITSRLVEPGDVVQGQTRLFGLADLSTLIARVQISELDVAGIQTGEAVDVTADAIPGATFRASVRRVFPTADSATRMVPVEVALAGGGAGRLKPGFTARVTFRLDERPSVLLAPVSALVGTATSRAVFVVKGDAAQRRDVRLGHMSGAQVEVLDGLAAGDQVVVAGADDLRDGGKVRVVRPVGSAAADGVAPKTTDSSATPNAGTRP